MRADKAEMDDLEPAPRRFVHSLWALAVAALLVAAALGLLLVAARPTQHRELWLLVPPVVDPSVGIPLRAFVYADLSAIEGPHLATAPLHAELLDGQGRRLSTTWLREGRGPSFEGQLRIPAGSDPSRVRVSVPKTEPLLSVEAAVTARSRNAGQAPPPRALRALQQLSLGAVRPPTPSDAGPTLVVSGGACVPEQPCEVFAVGFSPLSELRIDGRAAASVTHSEGLEGAVSIVRAQVVVHGPEATLDLRARSGLADGVEVQRAVRLPVALGSDSLLPPARMPGSSSLSDPRLALSGPPEACVVDMFSAGVWAATSTVQDCTVPFSPPFDVPRGLVRLQVHRDPRFSDSAAVRVIWTGALATLPSALSDVLAAPGADPVLLRLAKYLAEAPAPPPKPLRSLSGAALLAALETGLWLEPAALSSAPAAMARAQARAQRLRWISVCMVVLAGCLLLVSLSQRGLRAAAQAEAVMLQAGQDRKSLARESAQRRRRLGLSLLSLCLAFLAIAAYVLVRF